MGFDLSSLIGGSIGEAFQKIVGAFKVDPTTALKIQAQLEQVKLELTGKILDQVNSQIEVNAAEAKSGNLFVAGWRPFIGWICGCSFAWQFVLEPLVSYVLSVYGHPMSLPKLDYGFMSEVLMGMLGLGGMRTYEKLQNVQGNH